MAYQRNGYWYRSVRVGGQVRTEYLGAGDLGEMLAALARQRSEARRLEQAHLRAEQKAQLDIDRQIDAVGSELRVLIRAVLNANGYHQHRGHWRKRRGGTTNSSSAERE